MDDDEDGGQRDGESVDMTISNNALYSTVQPSLRLAGAQRQRFNAFPTEKKKKKPKKQFKFWTRKNHSQVSEQSDRFDLAALVVGVRLSVRVSTRWSWQWLGCLWLRFSMQS